MALTRLKLFKGDPLDELVESFSGFTDLAVAAAEQAEYSSGLTAINNGADVKLAFTSGTDPVPLLDVTDPQNPTFIVGGAYAVTIAAGVAALTAGGSGAVAIVTDAGLQLAGAASPLAGLFFSATVVRKFAAGDVLVVLASNRDGAVARQFVFQGTIVKLD